MISIIMSCIWVFISHILLQGGTESSTLRVAAAAPVDSEIRSSSLEMVLLGSTRHLLLQHSSSKPPAPHPRGASSSSSLGFGGVFTEGILEPDGSLSEARLLQIKTAVEENDDDDDDEDNSDEGDISTASSSAAAASPGDDVMIQEEVGFAPCPAYLRDAIPAHHHPHHNNNNSDDTSENMKETSSSCVILVPPLYVSEFRWPLSQSQAWLQNVVNSPLLHSKQANSWVEVQSSIILFHSGGPMYPFGAGKYLEHLEQLVPGLALGEKTRVVLDFGCGTGSLSVAMEQKGVTTLCVALSQSEEDGIQLVLERGYPGILTNSFSDSILVRLPYPNQAFDLLHCAACNISSWLNHHDGMLLLEADRILHSGGFFVWTVDVSLQLQSLKEMERQLGRLCWKVVGRAGTVTVWQKPSNISDVECHLRRDIPVCLTTQHGYGSTVWKVPLQNCIDDDTEGMTTTTVLEENTDWKTRLLNPPKRLWQTVPALGITAAIKEAYLADFNYWVYITDFYVRHFGPRRILEIRNVLDMNAVYGGFAAALALKTPQIHWWVLNVVPIDAPDRLQVIFDRSLIGVYHDWCESLDEYPRSFDLIHASRFFSAPHRCSIKVMVQEIDRLLRPGGFALIRDHKFTVLEVQTIARKLHWKTTIADTESGPMGTDKLLHCQKTKWS